MWDTHEHCTKLHPLTAVKQSVRRGRGIRTLPPEVLGNIFTFASNTGWRVAVNLSQVCRAWRELAHSTPRVWTIVGCANPQLLNHFLTLSNACLIDVDIQLSPIYSNDDPNDFSTEAEKEQALDLEIAQVVAPHSTRWRDFSLSSPIGNRVKNMLHLLSGSRAPRLRRLAVASNEPCDYPANTDPLPFPFLDTADMTWASLSMTVVDLSVSSNHITTLMLVICPEIWGVLKIVAPSVHRVYLKWSDESFGDFRGNEIITLTALHKLALDVEDESWEIIFDIIDHLIAPKLLECILRTEMDPYYLGPYIDMRTINPPPSPTHFPSLRIMKCDLIRSGTEYEADFMNGLIVLPHLMHRMDTVTTLSIENGCATAHLLGLFSAR